MPAKIGEYRKVPGRKARGYLVRAEKALSKTTVGSKLVLSGRGEGARAWDVDGNEFLVFCGVGIDNFGFGSSLKPIRDAVYGVLEQGIAHYPTTDWHNEWSIRAAEALRDRVILSGDGLAFPARSGAEAVEAALKAMRKARPKRDLFMRFRGAFHGRTHGSLCLLDPRKPERVTSYAMPYHTLELPFPAEHHDSPLEKTVHALSTIPSALYPRINGLFIEIIQGEGGINVVDAKALSRIVDFCHTHDIVFVADEIQSGMGRTGSLWAYEHYEIAPDMVLAGKSLGGGIADISATLMRKDLSFKTLGESSSTFGFEPLKAAAMLAAFAYLEQGKIMERTKKLGDLAIKKLHEALGTHPNIKNIRGRGLMLAVEFQHSHDDPAPYPQLRNQVVGEAEQLGLITLSCGFDAHNPSIRIMPPLIISEDDLLQGIGLLRLFLYLKKLH